MGRWAVVWADEALCRVKHYILEPRLWQRGKMERWAHWRPCLSCHYCPGKRLHFWWLMWLCTKFWGDLLLILDKNNVVSHCIEGADHWKPLIFTNLFHSHSRRWICSMFTPLCRSVTSHIPDWHQHQHCTDTGANLVLRHWQTTDLSTRVKIKSSSTLQHPVIVHATNTKQIFWFMVKSERVMSDRAINWSWRP